MNIVIYTDMVFRCLFLLLNSNKKSHKKVSYFQEKVSIDLHWKQV